MTNKTNRRTQEQATDEKLYKLSASSIQDFIKEERRHDELSRLTEVQEQKRIWSKTVIYSVLMNVILVSFALVGAFIK